MEYRQHATLGAVSFGLAWGFVSGFFVFVLGTAASLFGWGVPLAAALASIYVGYAPTFIGSIAGAVWAFATGFLFGLLVAMVYNRLVRRHARLRG